MTTHTITTEAERDRFYEDFTDAEARITCPNCPPGTSRKITWTEDGELCVLRCAGLIGQGVPLWHDFGTVPLPITVFRQEQR